jgi:hypothetical protein
VLDGVVSEAGSVSSFPPKPPWSPRAREKRESWDRSSLGHWSVGPGCCARKGCSDDWGSKERD